MEHPAGDGSQSLDAVGKVNDRLLNQEGLIPARLWYHLRIRRWYLADQTLDRG
jgi:hypothetical protein